MMPSPFKLLTFNIDMARREENFDATRFDVRWPRVLALIKKANADIVCLQELRNLDTSSVKVADIVAALMELGYTTHCAFYSPYKYSFATVIAYRRELFFVSGARTFHYHNTRPDDPASENNFVCTGLKFRDVRSSSRDADEVFWVYSTHLSPVEQRKWEAVRLLQQPNALDVDGDGTPFVVVGDFNFFDDMDGGTQRRIMLEKVGNDLAHPLLLEDGSVASGTFIGFEHDQFKRDFEHMSRLDHCFARGIVNTGPAVAVGVTREQLIARTCASDHLGILLHVALDNDEH